MKLNGGDIKAVQGDSGHAQVSINYKCAHQADFFCNPLDKIIAANHDITPPNTNGANAPIPSHNNPAITLAGNKASPANVE